MIKNIEMKFPKRTTIMVALLCIALLSIFVVAELVKSSNINAATIESLDAKKVTVMELAATAAASSTVISLIPGDVAMPIANQIAELTSYFIVVLGAILLEKLLVTVVGYVSFTYIIPFACLLGICYLYIKKEVLKNLAIRLAIFGILLSIAIPVSIYVSDIIYNSYQDTIEQTLETANQNKAYIDDTNKDLLSEDKNLLEKVGDFLANIPSEVANDLSEMKKKGEDTLSAFLDTIAILIITTCVIPILILLFFAWMIKILFIVDSSQISTIFQTRKPLDR